MLSPLVLPLFRSGYHTGRSGDGQFPSWLWCVYYVRLLSCGSQPLLAVGWRRAATGRLPRHAGGQHTHQYTHILLIFKYIYSINYNYECSVIFIYIFSRLPGGELNLISIAKRVSDSTLIPKQRAAIWNERPCAGWTLGDKTLWGVTVLACRGSNHIISHSLSLTEYVHFTIRQDGREWEKWLGGQGVCQIPEILNIRLPSAKIWNILDSDFPPNVTSLVGWLVIISF